MNQMGRDMSITTNCLQDITMTVDFTEAAGADRVAGWKTAAYAPIFHLEPLERKSHEIYQSSVLSLRL